MEALGIWLHVLDAMTISVSLYPLPCGCYVVAAMFRVMVYNLNYNYIQIAYYMPAYIALFPGLLPLRYIYANTRKN